MTLPFIHSVALVIGWIAIAAAACFMALLAFELLMIFVAWAVRRTLRRDHVRLWRVLFYARRWDGWPADAVTTKDGQRWVQVWDRFYWRNQ